MRTNRRASVEEAAASSVRHRQVTTVHPEAVPSTRPDGVPTIHQFVPALLPRDATGDHTLALRDAIREAGWCSDVYVESAHEELWPEAIYFERYPELARPGDVLLYQLSTASPVAEFLLERDEPLVLDYHNITPATFYEGWEDHTAEKVRRARIEASALAPRAVLGLADSEFNAEELRQLGCRITGVAPILTKVEDCPPIVDTAELSRLRAVHEGATVLLFVGRLSPNKAQHRLVEALWFYRRWYDPGARLHLVGPSMTPSYADAVFTLAAELGLEQAVRYGEDLTDAKLAAWYADADMFVCLSEHEGFCIPLLEAMRADLPIVAFAAGAVPETLGDAGIALTSRRPATVAAAVERVRRDGLLAEQLVAAGHRRLRQFLPQSARARFVDALRPLVTAGTARVGV
jgi:glycosyltransferase involved in cell wall biosynthesis